MSSANETYYKLINRVLAHGDCVGDTKELRNIIFKLDDVNDTLLTCRGMSLSYLIGELVWYFRARNDVAFISKFSNAWQRLSDDGETCNSAYGYLLMKKHGFNQIDKVIELLKEFPDSRRAVVNLNVPNSNVIYTKDEPCTIAIQFLIRNDKLDCTVMMRSWDLWLGAPYDIAFFTALQKWIAYKLRINTGSYTHFAVSAHLYKRHFVQAAAVPKSGWPKTRLDSVKLVIHSGWLEHFIKYYMTDTTENLRSKVVEEAYFLKILEEATDENKAY